MKTDQGLRDVGHRGDAGRQVIRMGLFRIRPLEDRVIVIRIAMVEGLVEVLQAIVVMKDAIDRLRVRVRPDLVVIGDMNPSAVPWDRIQVIFQAFVTGRFFPGDPLPFPAFNFLADRTLVTFQTFPLWCS
jgi:hypothetical protein